MAFLVAARSPRATQCGRGMYPPCPPPPWGPAGVIAFIPEPTSEGQGWHRSSSSQSQHIAALKPVSRFAKPSHGEWKPRLCSLICSFVLLSYLDILRVADNQPAEGLRRWIKFSHGGSSCGRHAEHSSFALVAVRRAREKEQRVSPVFEVSHVWSAPSVGLGIRLAPLCCDELEVAACVFTLVLT